jgi:acyl-coenzyme A synthetase/AMP-(fatty) acid ligase
LAWPPSPSGGLASTRIVVAEEVTPYKRIRSIETINEIPKSPSGRILRRLLEEREQSR